MIILKYQDYIKEEKINLPNFLSKNGVKKKKECQYLSIERESFTHCFLYLQEKRGTTPEEIIAEGDNSIGNRLLREDDLYRDFNDGYIDYMNKELVGKKIKIKRCIKIKKKLFGKERPNFNKGYREEVEIFFKRSYVEYGFIETFDDSKIYFRGHEKIYIESTSGDKYLLFHIMPLLISLHIQIVKEINRIYTKDDPYGEEEWISESIENRPKYKIGDKVYLMSSFSILDKYSGKVEICDITTSGLDSDDYYYGVIVWNGKEVRWINGENLHKDKNKYELKLKERGLTEKDIIKAREEEIKKIEEYNRKKQEQIDKMRHLDPYGEDDWIGESFGKSPKYNIGDTVYFLSDLSFYKNYHGKAKILDLKEIENDYFYFIELENGSIRKFIIEKNLFYNKKYYEKELKIKELRLKEGKLRLEEIKLKEELDRKKRLARKREILNFIDPYGEDNWED